MVGLHAQPRWRHPERGLLDADAFMDMIQTFGLQDDLAWWLVDQVLAQGRRWDERGLELQLSLGLPFRSLGDPGLVDRFQWLLRKLATDPSRVVLGISQAALADRTGACLEALARLRALGFKLAVEDYSPNGPWPQYLEQLPFDQFWITGNVVRGAREDESVQAGLVVALDVAQQSRLLTVGRGIAALDDWNRLQEWGCRLGEGAFIAAGMTTDEVPGWLAERDHRARAHGAMGAELDLGLPPVRDATRPAD